MAIRVMVRKVGAQTASKDNAINAASMAIAQSGANKVKEVVEK